MAKLNVPTELKTFWSYFEHVGRKYDWARLFDDFLTMSLTQFCIPKDWDPDNEFNSADKWHAESMARYNDEDKKYLNLMFKEMIMVYDQMIPKPSPEFNDDKVGQWYDFWGTLYETITSTGKKQGLGQFFTPAHICDMMAQMTYDQSHKESRINDPACGSGRTLLSHYAYTSPNDNYYCAEDIDHICCKMTALNMLIHGAQGEVTNCDALRIDDIRWSVKIKRVSLSGNPFMALQFQDPEKSAFKTHWNKVLEDLKKDDHPEPEEEVEKQHQLRYEKGDQLQLF